MPKATLQLKGNALPPIQRFGLLRHAASMHC
jgi:hypothetical protein